MKKFTDILEGLGRGREDDEYHTPDPTTRTHKVAFNVSKYGGEKHSRTVTISNSTKSREEAHTTAKAHLEKQGYKIHESIDEKCATCGKDICQCDDSHGFVSEAVKIGSKVKIHAPGKDYHGEVGHVGEVRHGAFKGAAKTYTVDYGNKKSVQLDKKNVKLHNEEVELDEAAKGHTIEAHGTKGTKGTPWRKTFKSHEHLNDWADKNDSVEVHGTRDLEHTKKTNEEVELDEVRMTAAMKLQKAFQNAQEKIASERKAGQDFLKKKEEPKKTNEELDIEEGLKPEHKMRPGWMLKADPELAKKVADNKKKRKEFKSLVGTKKD